MRLSYPGLDVILRGKLGYTYLRMMLRDNKFNEALLQSDTGRDNREIKATRFSRLTSRHSFQRNRRGQCARDFAPRYTMEMVFLKHTLLFFFQ